MHHLMISFLVLLGSLSAALIPRPRQVVQGEGGLVVDFQTGVIAPAEFADQAKIVQDALTRMTTSTHYNLTSRQAGRLRYPRAIRLGIKEAETPASYHMEITKDGLTISGSDREGLALGVQTLVQLLKHPEKPIQRMVIPCQTIEDSAAVQRRIFYVDVSGHLFPTKNLKELIDWLAFHKINEFHLGLNGDYGWRMESMVYPKLHEVGSVRTSTPPYGDPDGSDSKEYGGYYTQANLRELVDYARSRKVRLVPVLSFSTGASAIVAAYPGLGKKPEKVRTTWADRQVGLPEGPEQLKFTRTILEEVSTLFPDGVRIIDQGKRLEELGKVLENKKNALVTGGETVTDFSVYGLDEGAELQVDKKREAFSGLNPLKMVYQLQGVESVEAKLRTEYVHDFAKLQYQVFPRLAAFAEAGWLPAGERKYEDFRSRLDQMLDRYRIAGLKPSGVHEVVERQALYGTKVTTSMEVIEGRWPELAFDGDPETSFRSNSGEAGDILTFEFSYPVEGPISAATGGEEGDESSGIEEGVLEVSGDGSKWSEPVAFLENRAVVQAPAGTKFVRIRLTGDHDHAVILGELQLAEAVLVPNLEEVRELRIPRIEGEKVEYDVRNVVFAVNFEDRPELRDQIAVMRRMYFQSWHRVVDQLGVFYDPETKLRFELDVSKMDQLSNVEARDEMLKRLIPHLQRYRSDSPEWFVSGIRDMLRYQLVPDSSWGKSFGATADRSKALKGNEGTAAFFLWVTTKYGGAVLQAISQDCGRGGYRKEIWPQFTRKPFEEVLAEYQKGA